MESFVSVPSGSDFPLENLPWGAFTLAGGEVHVGVALGDNVVSATALQVSARPRAIDARKEGGVGAPAAVNSAATHSGL